MCRLFSIPAVCRLKLTGMLPDEVGALVVRAVKENQLHIMTHADTRPAVEERFKRILEAYDWGLANLPKGGSR